MMRLLLGFEISELVLRLSCNEAWFQAFAFWFYSLQIRVSILI